MENVIGYARISSTALKNGQVRIDGENNSIEVQIKKITEYCKFKGLNLIEIIKDEDVSGGKEFSTRVGGSKVFDYIDKGIKTVVAIKLDRLFRNTSDALLTIDNWDANDVSLHIIDMDGASFTTKTAIGRLMFTTVVSFSEYERKVTGERTKAVLNNRKNTEKSYCGAIFGFDNVGGKMVKNETEMVAIRRIFELKSKNISAEKIAEFLNIYGHKAKKGGKFHASTIQNILKNPIYNEA